MSKLKVIVFEEYAEDVIREFSKLGCVHIVDVKKSLEDLSGAEVAVPEERKLNRISELLGRIYYIMDILGIKEERDFFGSLKEEPKKIPWRDGKSEKQLEELEKHFSEIEKSVITKSDRLVELGEEKSRLEPEKAVLEALVRLNTESNWLGESRFLYTVAGLIKPEDLDKLRSSLEKQKIEFMLKEASMREKTAILLCTLKEYRSEVEWLLSGLDFQRFIVEKNKGLETLRAVRKRLDEIHKEVNHLKKELEEDKKRFKDKLFAYREVLLIEKSIVEAAGLMAKTRTVYVLEGWVPERDKKTLLNRISRVSDGYAITKEVAPKKGEIPPSKFDNPKIFKPFELLIGTLGMPSYNELDPTMVFALTFPLIYGLMFGDVGHGLILALIGVIFAYVGRKSSSARDIGFIVIICGISATFFGFVYGEAFGVGPGKDPATGRYLQEQELGFRLPLFFTKEKVLENGEVEVVPLYNPIHDPIVFLQLAVMAGSAHIVLGLCLNLLNKLKERKIFGAIGGPIPRLWLFCGLVYLFITYWIDFGKWAENFDLIVALIIVPAIMIFFGEIIMHLPHFNPKKIGADLGQGVFEVFDTFLMFLSNSISYSRIFALAMVHGGLFLALFSIGSQLKSVPVVGGVAWLIVIVIGTLAIISLESVAVFLHSLRLHYYEWFTKFYSADGLKFNPFKAERVYTKLEGGE